MANDGMGTGLARAGGHGIEAGTSRRESIEGSAIERRGETAATAQAERAKADILARFQVAMMRPRDLMVAREVLMKHCRRPGFAEVARYAKPVGGGKVTGPSVRFAEACLQAFGNMSVDQPVIFDDAEKRIIRVLATDLETNATTSTDVTVTKTVERKKLKQGQQPIDTRENSYGDLVYIVGATDDEITTKTNALVSKARRNCILQLVPGDIIEECMRAVVKTQAEGDKQDPDAAKKRMADAFFAEGVGVADLKAYLGHDVGTCSSAELADLRAIYASIRDGETTWREVMVQRESGAPAVDGEAKSAPTTRTGKAKAAAASAAAKARGEGAPTHTADGEAIEKPTHDPSAGEVAPEDEPPLPDAPT